MRSEVNSTGCHGNVAFLSLKTASGLVGNKLGTDESPVTQISCIILDLNQNKMRCSKKFNVAQPDCSNQQKSDEDVVCLPTFEKMIAMLESWLREFVPYTFCTDGPQPLRCVLHPEAFRNRVYLSTNFYSYIDLKSLYTTTTTSSLQQTIELFNIKGFADAANFTDCQNLVLVFQHLLKRGNVMPEVEQITKYQATTVWRVDDNEVSDDVVVKARGLPWQSSDQDIANFFVGLNIARGGVALCLSVAGRRNGEAMICLASSRDRELALLRHKHHLSSRYIEVYKSSAKEFTTVARGSNMEAQLFLSRHNELATNVIIRMRGLPYTCTADQVVDFFLSEPSCVSVLDGDEGVLFVCGQDERATGDAFVLFGSEEEAIRALTRHKHTIGTRYIELFKSTTAEVQQVLNKSLDPRTPVAIECRDASLLLLLPRLNGSVAPLRVPRGQDRSCLSVQGLPSRATVPDVLNYLNDFSAHISLHGVHLILNQQGEGTGRALVQMTSVSAAEHAAVAKQRLQGINALPLQPGISVFQCCADEVTASLAFPQLRDTDYFSYSNVLESTPFVSFRPNPLEMATSFTPIMYVVPNSSQQPHLAHAEPNIMQQPLLSPLMSHSFKPHRNI